MLNAALELSQMDYETSARNLAERFLPKLMEFGKNTGMLYELLGKLGDSIPDVLVFLMENFTDSQKSFLICEMANRYEQKLTGAVNGALEENGFGVCVTFERLFFVPEDNGMGIFAENVNIDYSAILHNETVLNWVENEARKYMGQMSSFSRLMDMEAEKAGALGIVRLTAKAAPNKVEEWILSFLKQLQSEAKLCGLLEKALKKEGLSLLIRNVSITEGREETENRISIEQKKTVSDGREERLFSPKAEELLIDALASYLKTAAQKNNRSVKMS